MAMFPEGSFDGQVCVVTGGGGGVGAHVAVTLARLGATVIVLGRTRESLDKTVGRIIELNGWGYAICVDVRDREGVEAAMAEAQKEFGSIECLVNSAAGNFRCRPEDLTPGGWEAITSTVLDGTWNCTQVAARQMIGAGRPGAIVSLGSSKARAGGADTVPSAAAKAGVMAMTKSLAIAWRQHGIRLNVVTPGVTTDTGAISRLFAAPGALEGDREKVPMGRHTTLVEVADAVCYLLSDYAGSITGTELILDGGRSLGIG